MGKLQFLRIKKSHHINNIFYQVPKFLFTGEFNHLSSHAKILYSILKERHELSIKNGWVDNKGNIFHIMTQKNMAEILGVSLRTITTTVKSLVQVDLIENINTGRNKVNRLYLNMVSQEKKGYSDSALQNRKRFTENDVQNQQFLQIPKFLFSNDFKGLSNDSRILYGLLKDKNELSIANNYVNENDEIYFNFSREDMMEMVGCSKPTIIKSINNLKEHFLLEEERIGLMKLNRIYLSYISDETYKMTKSSFIKAFNSIEVNKTTLEKVRESYSRLHISRSKDIACPEVKILRVLKSKYCVSRSKDIACPEVKILRGNKTVLNKTDFNKTYIYLSIIKRLNNLTNGHYEKEIELSIKEDRLIDLKYMIQELVESMLGYHDIKMKYEVTYFNDKAPILKSFRDVIVEYLLIPEELTKINNKMIPYELVADRLLAINHDTIILCVDKIFNLDKSVKNMNSYLLSTLYNSIVEDGATHHAIFNEKYYAN